MGQLRQKLAPAAVGVHQCLFGVPALGNFRLQALVGQPNLICRRGECCQALEQSLVFTIELTRLIMRDSPDSADSLTIDMKGNQ